MWDTVWFLFSSCLLIKKDIPDKREKIVNNCGPGDSKYFRKSTSRQKFLYLLRHLILASAVRTQLKKKKEVGFFHLDFKGATVLMKYVCGAFPILSVLSDNMWG